MLKIHVGGNILRRFLFWICSSNCRSVSNGNSFCGKVVRLLLKRTQFVDNVRTHFFVLWLFDLDLSSFLVFIITIIVVIIIVVLLVLVVGSRREHRNNTLGGRRVLRMHALSFHVGNPKDKCWGSQTEQQQQPQKLTNLCRKRQHCCLGFVFFV